MVNTVQHLVSASNVWMDNIKVTRNKPLVYFAKLVNYPTNKLQHVKLQPMPYLPIAPIRSNISIIPIQILTNGVVKNVPMVPVALIRKKSVHLITFERNKDFGEYHGLLTTLPLKDVHIQKIALVYKKQLVILQTIPYYNAYCFKIPQVT